MKLYGRYFFLVSETSFREIYASKISAKILSTKLSKLRSKTRILRPPLLGLRGNDVTFSTHWLRFSELIFDLRNMLTSSLYDKC